MRRGSIRWILPLACALAHLGGAAVPALGAGGRLVEQSVPGAALAGNLLGLETQRDTLVYLPPGYDKGKGRFPVLYLLHGIGDSNRSWTEPWGGKDDGYATLQGLLDRGIADGRLAPLIVVMPHVEASCFYANSSVKGNWEDFIASDLVGFVDRTYRTFDRPESRGVAGHSMGGHGAIRLGLKHPDRFGVVYALNPALLGWGGDVSTENPAFAGIGELRGPEDLAAANFYVQAIVGVGQAFAPRPDLPPLYTDLPFAVAADGLVEAEPGHARWQAEMPLYMLPRFADNLRRLRALRFDTAIEDEFSHIPITTARFSAALDELGIPHVFESYNGDHRNRLWGAEGRVYTELLPYFSRLLVRDAAPAPATAARQPSPPSAEPAGSRQQVRLWEAAQSGDLRAAEQALRAGADPDALDTRTNQNGRRALNWAAWNDRAAMIRWLAAHGADIHLANNTGFTPLHHAAETDSVEAARALLELGADPRARNRLNHTPLDTAKRLGKNAVAELLAAAMGE